MYRTEHFIARVKKARLEKRVLPSRDCGYGKPHTHRASVPVTLTRRQGRARKTYMRAPDAQLKKRSRTEAERFLSGGFPLSALLFPR